MNNADLPAFPGPSSLHGQPHPGMTKAEWFAANAPDMPTWFLNVSLGKDEDGREWNMGDWDQQSRYFRWRLYYGQMMAQTFEK